ncbi:uncharacterized protein LOC123526579 isoform X2 [Mercenaria mercenaria]|nr:uncharacterized protein LOC123526579 isoform X2 [Mercenaria mercenaria]
MNTMSGKRRKAFILYCVCVLIVSLLAVIESIYRWHGDSTEHDSDLLSARNKREYAAKVWQTKNYSADSAYNASAENTLVPDLSFLHKRNANERNKPIYLKDIFPNIKYPPFQPTVDSDFPTTDGKPRIPHIIHQTFRSVMLPYNYARYAKKLYDMNPSWQYMFWTDDSARRLIKDRYPELLNDWDSFNKSISKGDFLRYVVLYEFGGAYIDLDVNPVRPLDRVTMKYSCIIPTEPFEHNVFIWNTQIFMNNAIMFCRPKHPFFKKLLNNIKDTLKIKGVTEGTGPGFVTRNFIEYNGIDTLDENRTKSEFTSNSPYFYRGELPEIHDDAVYVPNTQYFTDNIDISNRKGSFRGTCYHFNFQTFLTKRACKEMRRRGMIRKDKRFKFLSHKWHHFWMSSENYERNSSINIRKIAPRSIIYREYDNTSAR